jgi:hypothetical protein
MSAQDGVEVTLPERACQVTVRYFTVSGRQYRDVVVLADDYRQRKEDGSLDAYLKTRVIPRLKREWYPFPLDPGDRWVLPVLLVDGTYVPDDDAPNPLDSYSASFGPGPEVEFPQAPGAHPKAPRPSPPGRRPTSNSTRPGDARHRTT